MCINYTALGSENGARRVKFCRGELRQEHNKSCASLATFRLLLSPQSTVYLVTLSFFLLLYYIFSRLYIYHDCAAGEFFMVSQREIDARASIKARVVINRESIVRSRVWNGSIGLFPSPWKPGRPERRAEIGMSNGEMRGFHCRAARLKIKANRVKPSRTLVEPSGIECTQKAGSAREIRRRSVAPSIPDTRHDKCISNRQARFDPRDARAKSQPLRRRGAYLSSFPSRFSLYASGLTASRYTAGRPHVPSVSCFSFRCWSGVSVNPFAGPPNFLLLLLLQKEKSNRATYGGDISKKNV